MAGRLAELWRGLFDALVRDNKVLPPVLALLALLLFAWVVAGAFMSGPEEDEDSSGRAELVQSRDPAADGADAPEVEDRDADSYAAYRNKDPFRQLLAPAEEAAPEDTSGSTPDDTPASAPSEDTTADDGGGQGGGTGGGTGGGGDRSGIDSDGDGISNRQEEGLGLDPRNPDTDGDGTEDGRDDADGDGIPDGQQDPGGGGGGTGGGGGAGGGGAGGGSGGGGGSDELFDSGGTLYPR